MQVQNHMEARAGPLLTHNASTFGGMDYWKTTIVIIAALFLGIVLMTHPGKAAQLENGVEIAFSRARQLLHEADKENRDLRPLPLSLAIWSPAIPFGQREPKFSILKTG